MADLFKNVQKYGTKAQLEALQNLGKSSANFQKKLDTDLNASIFQGDLKKLQNSQLGNVFSANELKQLVTLLDSDGDETISEEEVKLLSSAGGDEKTISGKDLKAFWNGIESYNNGINSDRSDKTVKESVNTKVNEKGEKIVTTTSADGTVKVVTYDKNGKKISSTKTDSNGEVTKTKYTYKDGKLASSEAKVIRKDENGKDYIVKTKETTYNSNGKKDTTVEKDVNGEELAAYKYSYDKKGNLTSRKKENADGTTEISAYNVKTGKIHTKTVLGENGLPSSIATYNDKGVKESKTTYAYDDKGNRINTDIYNYNINGDLLNRTKYNEKNQPILSSTYYHNSDGSMTRTDRDNSGKVIGLKEFEYNEYGDLDYVSTIDTESKEEKSRIVNRYNRAGQVTSKDKYIYERNNENRTNTTYFDQGNDGKIDSVSYHEEDESGNVVNSKFDNDNDGTIDEVLHFEYDEKGNIIGRYTDKNNDGIYDVYDTFENNKIVKTENVKKPV